MSGFPLFDHLDEGRAGEMRREFEAFDADNPYVWRLFVQFAQEAIRSGRRTLSASLIVERIRWEVMLTTVSDDDFKINNNFRAFYARKFMQAFPEYAGMFRTRKSVADDAPLCTGARKA